MGTYEVAGLVVVGVDRSPESVDAARYAAEAASRRGVGLLVVHAYAGPQGLAARDPRAATRGRVGAQRLIDETLSSVRVAPTTLVRRLAEVGTPESLLTGLSHGAALVVVGQHHFDPSDGLLTGPVESAVAARAGCPVVIVPRGWTRAPRRTAVLARRPIVVGLDEQTSAAAVLQFCYDEAELRQSSVVVLHAASTPGEQADEARAVAEIIAGQKQDHPDIDTACVLVPGGALDALAVASSEASLMVLGRPHRHHGARSWRHSVARAVMHQAHCPLVVVPPDLPSPTGAHGAVDTRVPVS